MDPTIPSGAEWSQITWLVKALWALLAAVAILGGSLLLSLAVIPSLVATHHLPSRTLKVRPLLLLGAALALVVLVWLVAYFVREVGVLKNIYDRWWI